MDPNGMLTVRVAGPDDAPAVRDMMRALATHEGSASAATSTEDQWREMLGRDDVTVLLALVDDSPIGYVSAVHTLHLWTGEEIVALDDLFVRPCFRNAGVGEVLMRALAARADTSIRWEVDEGNLRGQRFYLRLGARLRRKVVAWWEPVTDQRPRPTPRST